MVKKQILTEEQQQQKQQKKEEQILKSQNFKLKKLSSLSDKINKCHLPTIKLIYAYFIKEKINFYNDDDDNKNIIYFEMEQLNNNHIKEINDIIKLNNKHNNIKKESKKIETKKQKMPDKNYNNELILFND
jgi:hypothetical protein